MKKKYKGKWPLQLCREELLSRMFSSTHLVRGGFEYRIATAAASRRAMKKAACV
jgi:hypothetical protein